MIRSVPVHLVPRQVRPGRKVTMFSALPVALALAAGVAVIFSGIGLWCLHLARTQRYGIEIGREGL